MSKKNIYNEETWISYITRVKEDILDISKQIKDMEYRGFFDRSVDTKSKYYNHLFNMMVLYKDNTMSGIQLVNDTIDDMANEISRYKSSFKYRLNRLLKNDNSVINDIYMKNFIYITNYMREEVMSNYRNMAKYMDEISEFRRTRG